MDLGSSREKYKFVNRMEFGSYLGEWVDCEPGGFRCDLVGGWSHLNDRNNNKIDSRLFKNQVKDEKFQAC